MTTIQILVPMVGTKEQVPIYEFRTWFRDHQLRRARAMAKQLRDMGIPATVKERA